MRCLLAALIVCLGASASAAPNVRVTQYYRRSVCRDFSCQMQTVAESSGGFVLGRAADGRIAVLTPARGRSRGTAFLDSLEPGARPLAGEIVAVTRRHDMALGLFPHAAPLAAMPNVTAEVRSWVAQQLGSFPLPDRPAAAPADHSPPPGTIPGTTAAEAAPEPPAPMTGEDLRQLLREETGKLLTAHRDELQRNFADGLAQNATALKGLPPAIGRIMADAGPQIARQAVGEAVPGVITAIKAALPKAAPAAAAALGLGSIATGVGVPLGLALLAAGFLQARALRQFAARAPAGETRPRPCASPGPLRVGGGAMQPVPAPASAAAAPPLSAADVARDVVAELRAQAPAPLAAQPAAPAAPLLSPPATAVDTAVLRPAAVDTGLRAYQAMKEMALEDPQLAAVLKRPGVLQRMDSFFNQAMSGLAPRLAAK